eukprot:2170427-Prorocentrum_lima.AAC.1
MVRWGAWGSVIISIIITPIPVRGWMHPPPNLLPCPVAGARAVHHPWRVVNFTVWSEMSPVQVACRQLHGVDVSCAGATYSPAHPPGARA